MYALRQAEEGRVGVVVGSIGGRLVGRLFACRFRVGVCFVVASEEVHQGYDGGQRAFEVEEVNLLHIGAVGADAQQGLAYIEEVLLIHIVLLLHKLGKLAHAAQRFLHINEAAAELQVAVHPFRSQHRHTASFELGADVGESYFLFKIIGVYHRLIFSRLLQAVGGQ